MSHERTLRSGRIVPYISLQSLQPSITSSICFLDAALARNNDEITEDEYLQALLAHCSGLRHGVNTLCNNDELPKPGFFRSGFADNTRNIDTFAGSIAHWISNDVCKKDTRAIQNTTPIFQVLKAYRSNDVSALTAGFAAMDNAYEGLGDRESLTESLCRKLAALGVRGQEDKSEVMAPILERCHTDMGIDFEIAYHRLKKDESNLELIRIIDQSGYKSRVPKGMKGKKATEWLVRDIMFD